MTIKYSNGSTTSLIANVNAISTVIQVLSTAKMPQLGAGDYIYSTLISRSAGFNSQNNPNQFEIVKVNGPLIPGSSQSISVTRAQDGTVAQVFADGDIFDTRINAQTLRDTSTGGGAVTSVTGTSPIASSGGSTPNLSLVVPITVAEGGTGATTQPPALNNLLPSQLSKSGNLLSTDGTNATWLATLPITAGGTGQTTSAGALTALGAAPAAVPYLTIDTVALNPTDRDFVTGGSNIILTDAGAGTTLTMALSATPNVTTWKTKIAGFGTQYSNGNISGATTINLNNGQYQSATLTGNVTLTLTAPTGGPGTYQIDFTNTSTGSNTVTFPTFKWPGNYTSSMKQLSAGIANALDVLILKWTGSIYEANLMQNMGGLPVTGDPYFSSVVQLAHFNGTNGSQVYTNSCSRGDTLVHNSGTDSISTAIFKFNGSSLLVPASSGISNIATITDYSFGTGDFTIEWWQNIASLAGSANLSVDMRPPSTNGAYAAVDWASTGVVSYLVNGAFPINSSASTIVAATWQFITVCRVSGTTTLYVNGTSVGSFSDAANYANGALYVGMGAFTTFASVAVNYAELRITKGVGRYTSNFSVPTAPWPNM
jgi:hypothetical protein